MLDEKEIREIGNNVAEETITELNPKVMSKNLDEIDIEEDCQCDTLKPMSEWLVEPDQENEQCHECIIRPIAEYYLGALEEENAEDQIKQLEDAWVSEDLLTIGKTMDKIKEEVGEPLKKRLANYDCFAQTYKKPQAAEYEDQQED
jgi:hypothetical protein